ncbi:MAG: AI-2E family transporter [Eubacteriales bacterium]|nr:AI-2E family transporter [Eubacteriales bacterium]
MDKEQPIAKVKKTSDGPNLEQPVLLEPKLEKRPEPPAEDVDSRLNFKFGKERVSIRPSRLFLMALIIAIPFFLVRNTGLFYKSFRTFLIIIRPFLIGSALAFLIKIPLNFAEKNVFSKLPGRLNRYKRAFSLLTTLILIILVLGFCMGIILPQIFNAVVSLEDKLRHFVKDLSHYLIQNELSANYGQQLREWVDKISWEQVINNLTSFLKDGSTNILKQAISTTGAIASGTTSAIFAFFFMIYVLTSKERLARQGKRLIYSYFSERRADQILYVSQLMHDNFSAFIGGQFLDAVMISAWSYIGVLIIGKPGLIIVPVIMGITDLVPLIGPIIGTFLATLVVLIESPVKALVFFVYLLLAQQIQGNVIYPKLVGDRLGLPAMWTLVAVSLGGSLFGIVGMWLFCPLFAVIYLLLDVDTDKRLRERGIQISKKQGVDIVAQELSGLDSHPDYCEVEFEEPGVMHKLGEFIRKKRNKK